MENEKKVKKVRRRRKPSQKFTRLLVLVFCFCLLLSALLVRVGYIKYVHGEDYEQAAENQQINMTDYIIPALRGSILDSKGEVLVQSVRAYHVIMDSKVLYEADAKKQQSTVKILCDILSIEDGEKLSKYFGEEYKNYRYLKISEGQNISTSKKEQIQEKIDAGEVVGIWFEETELREHPYDSLAAHVLGFSGAYGLEAYYNEYLTGTQGRKMVVAGADGSYVDEYIAPTNGYNLTTTINASVQFYMEEILAESMKTYNAVQGCAVCMNPKTGAVYGMVNMPSFNLDDVHEVLGVSEKYAGLYDEEDDEYYTRIWNNFAITYTYQPGSTFKPIFASAALEEAIIGTGTSFTCNGYISLYGHNLRCAYGTRHGEGTLRNILSKSCNVGMTEISQQINKKVWLQYQEYFGVGQRTGIDLVGEVNAGGLYYTNETMGPVEQATTSFGQGFNMTPIQLMVAFSSVVNGGEIVQPYLVEKITDSYGNIIESREKEVLRQVISEETSEIIRSYLKDTVETGTGSAAQIDGYEIGGKTGTAQQGIYEDKEYAVSFIGFTPVEDPEVVLLVVLDRTDQASSGNATRTASAMFEKILPLLGLYPEVNE